MEPSRPVIGQVAADFELTGLDGEPVRLSTLVAEGPVVVAVLRGFPGYQCPICSRQVGEFVSNAGKFRDAGASVVMIYPGPAAALLERAKDFSKGISLPERFHLLIDPDYAMTNSYNLRWDAPRETAYPSTFVINGEQKIIFSKVSSSHGGRASAIETLEAIKRLSHGASSP